MGAYARLHALVHTLAKIDTQKFRNTLADLEDISYTLVEALGYV